MPRATVERMDEELDRHAGKKPEDRHPIGLGTETDPSDYGDPRVAQPGDDPPGERAMRPIRRTDDEDERED